MTTLAYKNQKSNAEIKEAIRAGQEYELYGYDGSASLFEKMPSYIPRADRKVIQAPNSAAAIVLGKNSDYAKDGGTSCAQIAIVAGVNGFGLSEDRAVDDLEQIDQAAGIFLTQRADSQKALMLKNPAGPNASTLKAFSDITAIADVVQLVSRNGGVNIYTGMGKALSSGVPNTEALGVNLIAHNRIDEYMPGKQRQSEYTLEPMVKGRRLNETLTEIIERISKITSAIGNIQLALTNLRIVLGAHTHIVPTPVPLIAAPSVELVVDGLIQAPGDVMEFLKSLTEKVNAAFLEINKSPMTTASIESRFHKLN